MKWSENRNSINVLITQYMYNGKREFYIMGLELYTEEGSIIQSGNSMVL